MQATNLSRVTGLYQQRRIVVTALGNLNGGGRIVQMTIAPPPTQGEAGDVVSVPTATMEYPAAMVEAIRSELQKRQAEIDQALGELGVTELNGDR